MDANIGRSHAAILIGLLSFALAIVTGGLPYSFWVISHLTLIKPLTSGESMSTYWAALLQQSHWHQENSWGFVVHFTDCCCCPSCGCYIQDAVILFHLLSWLHDEDGPNHENDDDEDDLLSMDHRFPYGRSTWCWNMLRIRRNTMI